MCCLFDFYIYEGSYFCFFCIDDEIGIERLDSLFVGIKVVNDRGRIILELGFCKVFDILILIIRYGGFWLFVLVDVKGYMYAIKKLREVFCKVEVFVLWELYIFI